MADFSRSQIAVLGRFGDARPWRYTTQPTYNPDGSIATPGVVQQPTGVFVLMTQEIADQLRALATAADQTTIDSWLYPVSCESPLPNGYTDAATWHVPIWAGDTRAVVWRIPAATWSDPTIAPPLAVKRIFRQLFA